MPRMFNAHEVEGFRKDGYVIVRQLAAPETVRAMRSLAAAALEAEVGPLEYEADLHYPGAPPSRTAPGGHTVRRLLQAYARAPVFRDWALSAPVTGRLQQLLGPDILLAQAHHNCIMTKQPRYSSITHWHQDIRYWAFERQELVSVWLALGPERVENGCLLLVPGSQAMAFTPAQFDKTIFFRPELPQNQQLIATGIPAELDAGDVLFFHCRTLHAAGRNETDATKFSVVFTYHAVDNHPLANTRSASTPEVAVA
ncbi:MAG: phytanoyl-CoA dioxygenase family protein [Gammaproteobacteria bacterium]|nr:phytanoyl-CoA dioxygenase family protein [Gammaproteobacteria bacterium]